MATLSESINSILQDLAGKATFKRGSDDFNQGVVDGLAQYGHQITAEVHGQDTYQVQLWLQNDQLQSRCTCPMGIKGSFCKHCVAVSLAWLENRPTPQSSADESVKQDATMADLRNYLAEQAPDTLIELIMQQAMEDARWREHLLFQITRQQSSGVDMEAFRRSLRKAIVVKGSIDYDQVAYYVEDIEKVLDRIADLLDEGYAQEAFTLCEDAIALIEASIDNIEDYDNQLMMTVAWIEDMHYQASQEAPIDSETLAEHIFSLEYKSQYGFFNEAFRKYAEVLGKSGKEAYERYINRELGVMKKAKTEDAKFRVSDLKRMKKILTMNS